MPQFVIERQYLVPMYQHIVIKAENLEEACKKGISEDIDWDTQEMDSDGARVTTITGAKLLPSGYNVSPQRSLIIASGDPKGHCQVGSFGRAVAGCGHDDITEPVSRLPLPVRGHRACGLALSLLQPELARC